MSSAKSTTIHFARRGVYHVCPRYVKSINVESIGQLHVLVRTDKDEDPAEKTDYNAENLYFYIDEICMMILRPRKFNLLKLRGDGDTWSEALRHQLVKHNILVIYATNMEVLRTRNMCEKEGLPRRFDYLYPRICPCKDVITLLGKMRLKKEPMMKLVTSVIQLIASLNEALANHDSSRSDLDQETKANAEAEAEAQDTSFKIGMKLSPHVKRNKFRGKKHMTSALKRKIESLERREATFCDGELDKELEKELEDGPKEANSKAPVIPNDDNDDDTTTSCELEMVKICDDHPSGLDFKFKEKDTHASETKSSTRGVQKRVRKHGKSTSTVPANIRPNRIAKPPKRDLGYVDSTLYIQDDEEAKEKNKSNAKDKRSDDSDDDDIDDDDEKEGINVMGQKAMVPSMMILAMKKPVSERTCETIQEPEPEPESIEMQEEEKEKGEEREAKEKRQIVEPTIIVQDVETLETASAATTSSSSSTVTMAKSIDLGHFITAEPRERFAIAGAFYKKDFVYTTEMKDISVVLVTTSSKLRANIQRDIHNLLLIKRNNDRDMYINLYELDTLFPGALECFASSKVAIDHVLATKAEMATLVSSGLLVDYSKVSRHHASICIRILDAVALLRFMNLYDPAIEMSILAARMQEERANRELQKRLAQVSDSIFGMKIIVPDKTFEYEEGKHDHVFNGYDSLNTTSGNSSSSSNSNSNSNDMLPCPFSRSDSLESLDSIVSLSSVDSTDSDMAKALASRSSIDVCHEVARFLEQEHRTMSNGDTFHTPKNTSSNKRRLFELEQDFATHSIANLSSDETTTARTIKRSRILSSDFNADLEAMRLHLDFDIDVNNVLCDMM